jgi:hypothetical protein
VVTAQLVDLHDLRVVLGSAGLQQALGETAPHLHERHQWEAGPPRVDLRAVAGDHARLLEAAHPLGHRGSGQVDPAAEFLEGQAAVGLELGQEPPVDVVQVPFPLKGHRGQIPSKVLVGPRFFLSSAILAGRRPAYR